jgi:hypothetical protein
MPINIKIKKTKKDEEEIKALPNRIKKILIKK